MKLAQALRKSLNVFMAIWSGNPGSRISIRFTSEEHELVALASYVMDF